MMELGGVVQGIASLERNLRRFMRPTGRHTAWHMRFGTNRIEYQPLGVVGVISPRRPETVSPLGGWPISLPSWATGDSWQRELMPAILLPPGS
ncbi:hypothetical protein [Nonomuraea recticatena]|uniref:Uncharacterized protein n=1 Tax=Nonomuraea recticatena TaxID=46178 RepID=A0ABN3S7Z0_9ACTN